MDIRFNCLVLNDNNRSKNINWTIYILCIECSRDTLKISKPTIKDKVPL